MIRKYSELRKFADIFDRFEYLRLAGQVGVTTFGFDRHLNQAFYCHSREWQDARRAVIIRDDGCDLGVDGYQICGRIIIHHMNPITEDDILSRNPTIYDPEYLICVSERTHLAIHYGDASLLPRDPVERSPGDTCLWR